MRNLYREFFELLPRPLTQYGRVLSSASGETRVELPGGAVISASGEATVGQRVWVVDGKVDGEAPDLPGIAVEV